MEQLVSMEVECDNCGEITDKKPAKVERNEHNFCSTDCYHTWKATDWESPLKKDKITLQCDHCGEDFKVHPFRKDSARFCSRTCMDKVKYQLTGKDHGRWTGGGESFTCQECGDVFKRYPGQNDNKFCSKSCYREASKEIFAGENNPVWRGGWDWYYGPNWSEQRTKAIERDNHECQQCGMNESKMDRSPDVHHIKRIGWFKEEFESPDWWERGNKLENLVTLCRSCHQQIE